MHQLRETSTALNIAVAFGPLVTLISGNPAAIIRNLVQRDWDTWARATAGIGPTTRQALINHAAKELLFHYSGDVHDFWYAMHDILNR